MNKKIIAFLTEWQVQLAILALQVAFSLLGLYNFFFNFNLSKDFLLKQSLEAQIVLTRSGARSIETYMRNSINQLLFLEKNDILDSPDYEKIRPVFRQFADNSDNSIADIARYDANGKLVIIENKQRIYFGEKEDFSDKNFIKWSKTALENQIFITPTYIAQAGSAKGKAIIVVATPSYFSHKYSGTITIRFILNEFKKIFIDPLGNVDEETMVIDSGGKLLIGKESLINQNLLKYGQKTNWKNSKDFVNKFKRIFSSNEGKETWFFQYPGESPKELLITYSKIDIPNTDKDLYLIITRNKPNVTSPIRPFFAYGTYWLGGGILLSFLIGLSLLFIKRFR